MREISIQKGLILSLCFSELVLWVHILSQPCSTIVLHLCASVCMATPSVQPGPLQARGQEVQVTDLVQTLACEE